jgi:hypothetical protein
MSGSSSPPSGFKQVLLSQVGLHVHSGGSGFMQGYRKSLVGKLYASLLDAVLLFERPASSFINTEPAYQPTNFNWRETNYFIEQDRPFEMACRGSPVS